MSDDDFAYGLDAEHIREVCRAATRNPGEADAVGDTIYVTAVGQPPRVYVQADDKQRTALSALRRVGYDAEPENPRSIAVRGWSIDRLHARLNALTAALYRLERDLRTPAARAIDICGVDAVDNTDTPTQQAARDAAHQAGNLLRQEITTITGPHVPHDPHIRPRGPAADLVARAAELEDAIAARIARAEYVATRAVERYVGYLTGPRPVYVPDHKAIRNALRDLRRPENTTPAATDHPAAVAAADHPADGRTAAAAPARPGPSEPARPQQASNRGRAT